MEHRRRLEHDRGADEERDRRERSHGAPREDDPAQDRGEDRRRDGQGAVQHLPEIAGVGQPEPVSRARERPREQEEPRGRVVVPQLRVGMRHSSTSMRAYPMCSSASFPETDAYSNALWTTTTARSAISPAVSRSGRLALVHPSQQLPPARVRG